MILNTAKESAKTREPIMRHMAYVFPDENFEKTTDQFMIGDTLLVAPVLTKETYKREVKLPKGKWMAYDETIYQGGESVSFDAPIDKLLYFERV